MPLHKSALIRAELCPSSRLRPPLRLGQLRAPAAAQCRRKATEGAAAAPPPRHFMAVHHRPPRRRSGTDRERAARRAQLPTRTKPRPARRARRARFARGRPAGPPSAVRRWRRLAPDPPPAYPKRARTPAPDAGQSRARPGATAGSQGPAWLAPDGAGHPSESVCARESA